MVSTLRLGRRGDLVRSVQWALIARGLELPRWGADGILGGETWRALADFASNERISWSKRAIENETGAVPKALVDRLFGNDDEVPDTTPETSEVIDVRPDRRGASPPKTKRHADGAVVAREPSKVTGIVVHQTAAVFGVSARQVTAAGGDKRLALRRRFLNVACHMAALRNGEVLLTNDLRTYVYHGNGLNRSTLGLEIEGRYPGLADRPTKTTWGGDPTPVTDVIVDAARRALKALVERSADEGMTIKYVYAHRQSSAMRRSDPGQELWQKVVLDYAVPMLGLKTRPRRTVGTGKTIPRAWDPDGYGRY